MTERSDEASRNERRKLEQQVCIVLQRMRADQKVIAGICDWLERQDLSRLGALPRPELQSDRLESRADRMEQQAEAVRIMLDTVRHQATKAAEERNAERVRLAEQNHWRTILMGSGVLLSIAAVLLFGMLLAAYKIAGVLVAHHP